MKHISYVNKKGQGHYYYVRIHGDNCILIQDTFLVSQYGTQGKAREAAIKWRDEMWKYYGLPKSKYRPKKRIKNISNTGHLGISRRDYFREDKNFHVENFLVCYRMTVNGKRVNKKKEFSYKFISEEKALKEAIKFRNAMVELHYDEGK